MRASTAAGSKVLSIMGGVGSLIGESGGWFAFNPSGTLRQHASPAIRPCDRAQASTAPGNALDLGANQALEDCYHLTRLLVAHNPSGAAPTTALLGTVFTEFERLRIARTSALVKRARQHDELLVVSGADACKKRDGAIVGILAGGARGATGDPCEESAGMGPVGRRASVQGWRERDLSGYMYMRVWW